LTQVGRLVFLLTVYLYYRIITIRIISDTEERWLELATVRAAGWSIWITCGVLAMRGRYLTVLTLRRSTVITVKTCLSLAAHRLYTTVTFTISIF